MNTEQIEYYPYVDEGNKLVYFNEECIVEQFVEMKWHGSNKSHYVSQGYKFTKMRDVFIVDVRDLTKGSHVQANIICPICQHVRKIGLDGIFRTGHSKCHGCACINDLVGQSFAKLTVVKFLHIIKNRTMWLCECECGNTTTASTGELKTGGRKTCGCSRDYTLVGQIFGRLEVIKKLKINKRQNQIYLCECECGNMTEVLSGALSTGNTNSCGCIRREQVGKKHPRYDPTLTDKDRKDRRGYDQVLWAKEVKERDEFTCQCCGQCDGTLESHHLNSYKKHPKQRNDLNNGVTLCRDCHNSFHTWMGGTIKKSTRDNFINFCNECYPDATFLQNLL